MTIKEATQKMLIDIRYAYNREKRTSDKEIAKIIGITPATLSRLYTKVTMPKIMTWQRIINIHRNCMGLNRTEYIINQIL